jgi:hypothetical protein
MKRSPKAVAAVAAAIGIATLVARKRGYGIGSHTIARCKKGHLFTTMWIPGVSLKAIRLGPARLQYCPVGEHWSLVTPVKDSDLTEQERRSAEDVHDLGIP